MKMSSYPERVSNKLGKIIYDNSNIEMLDKVKFSSPQMVSRGLYSTFMTMVTWGILIKVGMDLNVLGLCLAFQMSFLVFRYRFGGAHATNPYICIVLTAGLPLLGSVVVNRIVFPMWSVMLIVAFSLLSAIMNGVKDNPKFSMSKPEQKKKRQQLFFKQGIVLIVISCIIQVALYRFDMQEFAEAIMLGQVTLFVNLML